MQYSSDEQRERQALPFSVGDKVQIVQGPDTGRAGLITAVYPSHARPYRVQLGEGWFVHFAEDRLAHANEVSMAARPDLP